MRDVTALIADRLETIWLLAEDVAALAQAGKYDAQFEPDKDKQARADAIFSEVYNTSCNIYTDANTLQNKVIGYEVREDIASQYGWKLDLKGRVLL